MRLVSRQRALVSSYVRACHCVCARARKAGGLGEIGGRNFDRGLPAVRQLAADVLEVVVAHVVDAKDEAVLVLGDGIANVLKELVLLLAALFVDLGEVKGSGALRLGHLGGLCICNRPLFPVLVPSS